jgi:hypothetical protein
MKNADLSGPGPDCFILLRYAEFLQQKYVDRQKGYGLNHLFT